MRENEFNEYYVWMPFSANVRGRVLDGYYVDFSNALKWARFRATRGFPCWYIKRLRDGVIIAQSREG